MAGTLKQQVAIPFETTATGDWSNVSSLEAQDLSTYAENSTGNGVLTIEFKFSALNTSATIGSHIIIDHLDFRIAASRGQGSGAEGNSFYWYIEGEEYGYFYHGLPNASNPASVSFEELDSRDFGVNHLNTITYLNNSFRNEKGLINYITDGGVYDGNAVPTFKVHILSQNGNNVVNRLHDFQLRVYYTEHTVISNGVRLYTQTGSSVGGDLTPSSVEQFHFKVGNQVPLKKYENISFDSDSQFPLQFLGALDANDPLSKGPDGLQNKIQGQTFTASITGTVLDNEGYYNFTGNGGSANNGVIGIPREIQSKNRKTTFSPIVPQDSRYNLPGYGMVIVFSFDEYDNYVASNTNKYTLFSNTGKYKEDGVTYKVEHHLYYVRGNPINPRIVYEQILETPSSGTQISSIPVTVPTVDLDYGWQNPRAIEFGYYEDVGGIYVQLYHQRDEGGFEFTNSNSNVDQSFTFKFPENTQTGGYFLNEKMFLGIRAGLGY